MGRQWGVRYSKWSNSYVWGQSSNFRDQRDSASNLKFKRHKAKFFWKGPWAFAKRWGISWAKIKCALKLCVFVHLCVCVFGQVLFPCGQLPISHLNVFFSLLSLLILFPWSPISICGILCWGYWHWGVDESSSFTRFEVVDSLSGFHCDVFLILVACAFKFIIKMCPREIWFVFHIKDKP